MASAHSDIDLADLRIECAQGNVLDGELRARAWKRLVEVIYMAVDGGSAATKDDQCRVQL